MKKICLSLFLISLSVAIAQTEDKKISAKLPTVMDVLEIASLDKSIWGFSMEFLTEQNRPIPTKNIFRKLITFLAEEPINGKGAEFKLVQKYEVNLKDLLDNLENIGEQQGEFIKSTFIPTRFALKENDLTFLLTSVESQSVYNTLRSKTKESAADVIVKMILPALDPIYKAFKGTTIKFLGMSVNYCSKDFSNESNATNLKSEMIALVVPIDKCKSYIEGKITDVELVNYSDVFHSGRETTKGVKKIQVSLE